MPKLDAYYKIYYNMKNPLISIITVSFNSVKTIEETIKSVIAQTYPKIEYIIIDGGSNDGTIDIIKKYENRISYWISEPDKGIYNAMNKGIIKSSGDYILFINSDDQLYASNTIDSCIRYIDDSVDVLYGDLVFNYINKQVIRRSESTLENFNKYMPLFHPATIVKKVLLDQYKFDEKYRIAADYKLLYTLYKAKYSFKKIDVIVAVFNAVDGVSNTNIKASIKESFKVRAQEKWFIWWPKWILYCFLKTIGWI